MVIMEMTLTTIRSCIVKFGLALCLSVICCMAQAQEYKDYYKASRKVAQQDVTKSSINYGPIAAQICDGCTNDYQRARAIYQWMCEHISYDTSYKIRTADECYKHQKGVCQGYCELYYQLAKAVGVQVEIIYGKSKDQTGYINPAGHGWLFAYTAADRGILMDPTWGAGAVTAEGFVRDEYPMLWFNVDPEWMILSHFPEQKGYQLLERPMDEKTFMAIAPVDNRWIQYGASVHQVYEDVVNQRLSMPQFYSQGEEHIQFLEFPMAKSLQIGHFYDFRVKLLTGRDFLITNNGVFTPSSEWTAAGDGTYSIRYMPRDTQSLGICIRDAANTSWSTVLKYDIAEPTAADWKRVEQQYPEYAPEMKAVKNKNPKEWREAGFDERRMLDIIREQHITELPIFFDGKGQYLSIESVPMTRQLNAGQSYTFSFYPKSFVRFAIVNGEEWFTDWKIGENSLYSLTLTPATPGKLSLYVQTDDSDSYWPCLEYEVR